MISPEERRAGIIKELTERAGKPVSAAALASRFGVSRQVIVGDVAILRASGENITATPRGYVPGQETEKIVCTVACCHSSEDMQRELEIMVDNGCLVKDVIVEHPVYGQLTGSLELKSRYDIRQFIRRQSQSDAQPLSVLTAGVHLHTLVCEEEWELERVKNELDKAGFLLK